MSSILLKRSAEPNKVPSVGQLELGELAVNTHDGKVFFKRDQEGDLRIRELGARDNAANVYYVKADGDDSSDGKTIGDAFATLNKALSVCEEGSTIYVKSGVYVIDNPVEVPAFVAILGDSLRTTIIKPSIPTQDIFHVRNGAFIKDMRLSGHESPAAAVAFPPNSGEVIYNSPYVQNCTSDTTTGTGLRIDGNDASGTKSMVVDSYTQYNQGGIGVHHLNGGNSQLVSLFTICCETAVLCESGGFCSLTNSNSSFGTKGLVSDGTTEELYSGTTGTVQSNNSLIINDLVNIPYINNSVTFEGSSDFYNVLESTPLQIGDGAVQQATYSGQPTDLQVARTTVLAQKEAIQKTTIEYINQQYPTLDYNRSKCARDVGLIIESVLADMVLNTNYRTAVAGRSYYRGTAGLVISDQLTETLDAIQKVKSEVLSLLSQGTTEYSRTESNFDIIIDIVENGLTAVPEIVFTNPDGMLPEVGRARNHIINNKEFLVEEAIAAIGQSYPLLGYDRETCERDVGLVVDAISYDMVFDANFRSITAGLAYFREGAAVVLESQKTATVAAFNELKSLLVQELSDATAISRVETLMDIIIGILDEDSTQTTPAISLTDPTDYNTVFLQGYGDARDNIQTNRDFVEEEVIAFINTNFSDVIYDEQDCRRDIGYILDALRYDLTYGGNLETLVAGRAYYSDDNQLQVGSDEKEATLAAYGYLSTLVEKIALNESVDALQSTESQVTVGLTASTPAAATQAGALVDDIITLIADDSSQPAEETPDITWASATLQSEFSALQSARSTFQSSVTEFLENNFAYDTAKCKRDLRYILDGITYDVTYKGNSQSYDVAIQYYSGGKLQIPELQKKATADAIIRLTDIISDVFRANETVPLQTKETQDTSESSTTLAEIRRAETLFKIVESVVRRSYFIDDFLENQGPDIQSQDQSAQSARDTLLDAKESLQVETIKFINENFSEFEYDEEVCFRDVGLMIDAVAMDAALGTNYNSVVAGLSYQRASLSINKVKSSQFAQTLNAVKFVKSQAENLSLSATGLSRVTAGFDEIIDIFENNTPDAVNYPAPSPVNQDLVDAKNQLQANKSFITEETIAFINEEFQNFTFDQAKCERDLGLILDAVLLDTALNTNYNTLVAAESYYRATASLVITDQKIQTLGAIRFFRDQVDQIPNITVEARLEIVDRLDTVLEIVDTGDLSRDKRYVNPDNASDEQIFAKNLLTANKEFIQKEIIAYVNQENPGLDYDIAKCERDVGFIVDALKFDILYGGNTATVISADSYFVGTTGQLGAGEEAATIDAYTHLKSVIGDVVTANLIDKTPGNDEQQLISSEVATQTEIDVIDSLVDEYITVISDGNTDNLSEKTLPDITWTEEQLQIAYEEVDEERARLISETINFINEEYQNFSYDETKCARDVEFIVDGLSYDILYGGNSATIQVAKSYFSQFENRDNVNQLGEGETDATITAYKHLKNTIETVVQGETVTATPGNTETQNFDSNNATEAEANRLSNLVSIIIDVLKIRTDNNTPDRILPSIAWTSADLQSDFDTLTAAKPTIQQSTLDFINERYVNFNYNQFKCSRDVGLIIEAIVDDVVMGTNYKSIIAGSSYYRASASAVIDDQLLETVESLKFLKQRALEILSQFETSAPSVYSDTDARFDTVINILNNGTGAIPAIQYNVPTGATTDQENAVTILRANRDFFIEEGIAFISENFPLLGYDRDLCERDVGLVVDALGYDLQFGSNFRSVTAGRSYYREGAAVVTEDQKAATLAAFGQLKTLASDAVTDTTAKASIESNMDLIIAILDNGLSAVPASYTIPVPTGGTGNASDTNIINARNNIEANRDFIKAEIIEYVAQNYPTFNYSETTCERDVDYILDALFYDLTYGGNLETLVAGGAYYSGVILQLSGNEEKEITLDAYTLLQSLVETIALDNDVSELQTTVAQTITGNSSNAVSSELAGERITEIRTLLDSDSTVVSEIEPDTSWVASELVTANSDLQAAKADIKSSITEFIEDNFAYDESICKRDIGYIIDALCYDILYGGNSQMTDAASEYFSGGTLQVSSREREATIRTYKYIRDVAADTVLNIPITTLQDIETQNTSAASAASGTESSRVETLFKPLINLLEHGYSSIVTFDTRIQTLPKLNEKVSFFQNSLITASGHTFEWVGAGTNINSALPYQGGKPVEENQVIETNNGKVYFTSTDQKGDFKIGPELTIERASGTITGEAFDRSLFSVLTPYILSLQ